MPQWLILQSELEAESARLEHSQKTEVDPGSVPVVEGRSYVEAPSGVGVIQVHGVLLDAPNAFYDLIGRRYTDYPSLIKDIRDMEASPGVRKIIFDVDSPGGVLDGAFTAADAVRAVSKPTEVRVRNLCASAAYLIASQADKIVATNRACRLGSVGVVGTYRTMRGEKSVTSSAAPNKRPDPGTEQGRDVIRAELDDMHDLMAQSIASGRKVTREHVDRMFGRGGVLVASKALSAGMVDSIEDSFYENSGQGVDMHAKTVCMNLETLRAEHPALYKQVLEMGAQSREADVKAAQDLGQKQERQRVLRHLKMGETANALNLALNNIKEGAPAGPEQAFDYQEAALAHQITAYKGAAVGQTTAQSLGTSDSQNVSSEVQVLNQALKSLGA